MTRFFNRHRITRGALVLTGGILSSLAQPTFAQSSEQLNNVYITWYGFNDNSCTVESQHNCNTIAYPKGDGYPVPHDIATEGTGTYADPITFAAAVADPQTQTKFAPGTIIYVPLVRKYFVMEDSCFECTNDWQQSRKYHVDLWMGPSFEQNAQTLYRCENSLTQGDSRASGTGIVLVNPPANLPVESAPIYRDGQCTTRTFLNDPTAALTN